VFGVVVAAITLCVVLQVLHHMLSRPGHRDRVIKLIFTCQTARLLVASYDLISSFLLTVVARCFFTLPTLSPSFLSLLSPSGTFRSRLPNALLPSGSFCTLLTCFCQFPYFTVASGNAYIDWHPMYYIRPSYSIVEP
jgi:hypothetical protein